MDSNSVKPKLICINGFPKSGKCTIAEYISSKYKYKTISMKDPSYYYVSKHFKIPLDQFMDLYTNQDTKDMQSTLLRGHSPRSALIYYNEEVLKKKLGRNVLATMISDKLKVEMCDYVISDIGFVEELIEFKKLKTVYDVYVVRLIRDGSCGDTDVRHMFKCPTHTIYNDDSVESLYIEVDKLVDSLQ